MLERIDNSFIYDSFIVWIQFMKNLCSNCSWDLLFSCLSVPPCFLMQTQYFFWQIIEEISNDFWSCLFNSLKRFSIVVGFLMKTISNSFNMKITKNNINLWWIRLWLMDQSLSICINLAVTNTPSVPQELSHFIFCTHFRKIEKSLIYIILSYFTISLL